MLWRAGDGVEERCGTEFRKFKKGRLQRLLHSDVSVDNPAILQLLMSYKLYSICVLAVSALRSFDVNACYLGSHN